MFRWMTRLTLVAVVCCAAPCWSADVEFPDANLDTVIREILKKKQIALGSQLSDEIINFLAYRIRSNVRLLPSLRS